VAVVSNVLAQCAGAGGKSALCYILLLLLLVVTVTCERVPVQGGT